MANPIINIGVAFDLKRPLRELEAELDKASQEGLDLGISKSAEKEINNLKKTVQGLSEAIDKINNKELGSAGVAQLEKDFNAKIQSMADRTKELQDCMSALMSTMSNAQKEQVSKSLENITRNANEAIQTTSQLTDSISSVNKAASKGTPVKFNLGYTKQYVHELEEISKGLEKIDNYEGAKLDNLSAEKAKEQLEELIVSYLNFKKQLEKSKPGSDEFNGLQKNIAETSLMIQRLNEDLYESIADDKNLNKIFRNKIDIGNNTKKFADDIIEDIKKETDHVLKDLNNQIENIKKSAGSLSGNDKEGYKIPIVLGTTKSDFLNKVLNIINFVRENIEDEKIEVGISLVTEWGSRKLKEQFKEFSEKVQAISKETGSDEIKAIYNDITKYFNDEITIKIKSDIEKVAPQIIEKINDIRNNIKKDPLKLDLDAPVKETEEAAKEQEEVSKFANMTKEELEKCLKIEERYIKKCKEGSDKYKERKADIEKITQLLAAQEQKEEKVNKPLKIYDESVLSGLNELAKKLDEISKSSRPISEDLFSIQESLEKLKVGNVTQVTDDVEKLDADFEKIKQDLAQINGALRKENLTKIQNTFKAYTDYLNRGGKRNYTELSDKQNIQNYFKNHLKNVLNTSENDYRSSGRNVGLQFAEGITESIGEIVGAVTEMVNVALNTIQIVQDSASPSKKTYELGWDFVAGYAEGIHDGIKNVSKAAGELADNGIGELADKTNERGQQFADSLERYLDTTPKNKNTFFNDLSANFERADDELQDFINDLGIAEGKLKLISDGANNFGGIVGQNKTLLARQTSSSKSIADVKELQSLLQKAHDEGVGVARILDIIESKTGKTYLEIQETVSGKPISDENFIVDLDVLKATDDQINKLMSDIVQLYNMGIDPDIENLSNVFYDVEKGVFTLIDLGKHTEGGIMSFKNVNDVLDSFIRALRDQAEDIEDVANKDAWNKLADRAEKLAASVIEAANKGAAQAQKSHSPSKVAEKLGEYWGEGYAKGIRKHAKDVEQSIRELVNSGKLTVEDLQEDLNNLQAGNFGNRYKQLGTPLQNILADNKSTDIIDRYKAKVNEVVPELITNFKNLGEEAKNVIRKIQEDNLEGLKKGILEVDEAVDKLADAFYDLEESQKKSRKRSLVTEADKTTEEQKKQDTQEQTQALAEEEKQAEKTAQAEKKVTDARNQDNQNNLSSESTRSVQDARVNDLEKEQKQAQETAQAEKDLANARKQANSGENTLSDDELRMYADWAEESTRAERAFEESVVPLDKISEGLKEASKYSDNLLDSLEKLPPTVQKGLIPIDGNHWRGLDRIAQIGITEEFRKDKKKYTGEQKYTEKQISDATNILKLAGDFQQTGDTSYLKELYKSIDSSEISGKMKKALKANIRKIVDEIQNGAKEAVDETIKEKKPTKTVTMSRQKYKDYVKQQGIIADNEAFNYNFDLHLQGLKRKGLAEQLSTKSGKGGKWVIKVEVEDDEAKQNIQEIAELTEKELKDLTAQEHEFVDGLTPTMSDQDIKEDLQRAETAEKIAAAKKLQAERQKELNQAEREFVDSLTPTMTEEEIKQDLAKADAMEALAEAQRKQAEAKKETDTQIIPDNQAKEIELTAEETERLAKAERDFVDSLNPRLTGEEAKKEKEIAKALKEVGVEIQKFEQAEPLDFGDVEKQTEQIKENTAAKKETVEVTSKQAKAEKKVTEAIKEQKTVVDDSKKAAKAASEQITSSTEESKKEVDKLNQGFEKLKALVTDEGNFNLRQNKSKNHLQKYVDQFIKYKERNGEKELSDLTDNPKALGKLQKEYERQIALRQKAAVTEQKTREEQAKTTEQIKQETSEKKKETAVEEQNCSAKEKAVKQTKEATQETQKQKKATEEIAKAISEAAKAEKDHADAIKKANEEVSKIKQESSKGFDFSDLTSDKPVEKLKETREEAEKTESVFQNLVDTIKSLSSYDNKSLGRKEQAVYANLVTGKTSQIETSKYDNAVTGKLSRELLQTVVGEVDTFIHSHPESLASFSPQDIKALFNRAKDGITKALVVSFDEVASFDASKINAKDFDGIFNSFFSKLVEETNQLEQLTMSRLTDITASINSKDKKLLGDVVSDNINVALQKTFEAYQVDKKLAPEVVNALQEKLEDKAREYINSIGLSETVNPGTITEGLSSELKDIIGTQIQGDAFEKLFKSFKNSLYNQIRRMFTEANSALDDNFRNKMQMLVRDTLSQSLSSHGYKADDIYKVAKVDDYTAQLLSSKQQPKTSKKDIQDKKEEAKATEQQVKAEKELEKTKKQTTATEKESSKAKETTTAKAKEATKQTQAQTKAEKELNTTRSQKSKDSGATASAQGTEKEAKFLGKVQKSANDAAKAKEAFSEANREVLDSIIESLNGLKNEGTAFGNLSRLINSLGGKNGAEKLEATRNGIQEIINALSVNVDDNSLIDVLHKITENGSNLADITTILRASKKNLEDAMNVKDTSDIDDILNNNIQQVVENAKSALMELGGEGSSLINISDVTKTRDGFLEIVGLIRTADEQLQQFTLHTKDGLEFQNVGVKENTAQMAKQMKMYAQVEEYMNRMKQKGEMLSDRVFINPDFEPEVWEQMLSYVEEYRDYLGEIKSITLQTRQDATGEKRLESWSVNGKNGNHVTVGPSGNVVASHQDILSTDELIKKINHLISKRKEYNELLDKRVNGNWSAQDIANLNALDAEYQEVIESVERLNRLVGDNEADQRLNQFNADMTTDFNKTLTKFADSSGKKIENALKTKNNQLTTYVTEYKKEIDKAQENIEEFYALIKKGPSGVTWSDEERQKIQAMANQVSGVTKELNNLGNVYQPLGDVDKLIGKISKDLNENTAMSGKLRRAFKKLRDEIKALRGDADGTEDSISQINKIEFKRLGKEFDTLHSQMIETKQMGDSFFGSLSKAAKNQSVQFLARYLSFYDLIRYFRTAYNAIDELDYALVDLRKTTTMNAEELNNFYINSTKVAKEMGVTTKEIIDQASSWSRLNEIGLLYGNV